MFLSCSNLIFNLFNLQYSLLAMLSIQWRTLIISYYFPKKFKASCCLALFINCVQKFFIFIFYLLWNPDEIFLGMRSDLSTVPCSNVILNFSPILSKDLNCYMDMLRYKYIFTFYKSFVFLFCPSSLWHIIFNLLYVSLLLVRPLCRRLHWLVL